jgi:hypothetical protein
MVIKRRDIITGTDAGVFLVENAKNLYIWLTLDGLLCFSLQSATTITNIEIVDGASQLGPN